MCSSEPPMYNSNIPFNFKWNGTYLGILTSENILTTIRTNVTYCRISYKGCETTCILRWIKNSLPCLIDEIKPLFGLEKLGTHWAHYKSKCVMLIQYTGSPYYLLKDIKSKYPHIVKDKSFLYRIQQIYVFREILQLSHSNDSSIRVLISNQNFIPISFTDSSISHSHVQLPKTVIKSWFNVSEPSTILLKMFPITHHIQISEFSSQLLSNIQQLSLRIDPDTIGYASCISDTITLRLLYITS